MSDLPANSKKAKDEGSRPKVVRSSNPLEPTEKEPKKEAPKQIVNASVKPVKESAFRRFKSNFFGSDVNSVMGYITAEVLLPALKDLVVDTASKGIERMMYGEVRSSRRRSDGKTRYSYDNPINVRSSPYPRGRVPAQAPRGNNSRRHMVGEVLLDTKGDADRVLETMSELIDRYGVVSLADLYSLLGHTSNYIDNNWGWTELLFANAIQTQDGWVLDLPPLEHI